MRVAVGVRNNCDVDVVGQDVVKFDASGIGQRDVASRLQREIDFAGDEAVDADVLSALERDRGRAVDGDAVGDGAG